MFRLKALILASVSSHASQSWPSTASAQSAIGGTVKDTCGAVLPGVTVEAAQRRPDRKNACGRDRLTGRLPDRRSASGHLYAHVHPRRIQTFKRDALELPSNFTATVNADLKVGALEESVTVSGASPVVDVSTNVKAQVLPRDVLDAVPTARTIQSLGQLVVGVTLSSPDVGGSRAMQQTYFAVHGVGASRHDGHRGRPRHQRHDG